MQIHSDNGTSFVGAHNDLKLEKFFIQENVALKDAINELNINWHFIPAYLPHFGGLWEAGLKSIKFHLKRVAANVRLTLILC